MSDNRNDFDCRRSNAAWRGQRTAARQGYDDDAGEERLDEFLHYV